MRTNLLLGSLLLLACNETTFSPGQPVAGTGESDLPCEVEAVLAQRCRSCHATEPKFGAPMPLMTRAQLTAPPLDGQGTIAERAVARMGGDMDSRMPPPPNEAATAGDIAAIQGWIDAGYPARDEGEDCGGGGGGAGGGYLLDCEPDLALTAKEPFEMPATSTDEQVCFGIDVPAFSNKRHITAIAPRIDNSKIIHHILLLQAPESVSPDPAPCGFTSSDWKLLYAWGPGTPPHELPAEAGFPIDAGETVHFVLQVHYNNLSGLSGEIDQSGIDLCTTEDLRPFDADIMALGGIFDQDIPPMSTAVADCSTPIPAQADPFFPVTVFQAWPHMHVSGKALHGWIENASGTTPIVDAPDYDFNYQITYPTNVQLAVSDTVRTTCEWQNTTASAKSFGEDTNDEMCFNFVSYYPRIETSVWHWLLPAYGASCTMQVK